MQLAGVQDESLASRLTISPAKVVGNTEPTISAGEPLLYAPLLR